MVLRQASDKFSRRFRAVEALAAAQNRRLADLSEAELDALWQAAKARLSGAG